MDALCDDTIFEIMQRIPLKSVVRWILVSKEWKRIINLYLIDSVKTPRLLFAYYPMLNDVSPAMLLYSVNQDKEPLLSSSQQKTPIYSRYSIHSGPLQGLVCLQSHNEVVLCNPCTEKLLILPEIEDHKRRTFRTCYLGYDEVTDVLKVLLLRSVYENDTTQMYNQVLTVGPGEIYWRAIACDHPYDTRSNGLCIGGILYYGAVSRKNRLRSWKLSDKIFIIVRFNVRSEEFTIIEWPNVYQFVPCHTKLVNYNGKVALVTDSMNDLFDNGEFQICVRDESAGIWRIKSVVIPHWRPGRDLFSFNGTIGTGELIFSNKLWMSSSCPHLVLYYDPVTQNLRKFKVQGVDRSSWRSAEIFLNHFDTLLLTQ